MDLRPPDLRPPDLRPADLRPLALSVSGSPPFRPICDAAVIPPPNTSLQWRSDGELAALDLHNVLARLCEHDSQACQALENGSVPPL